MDRFSLDDILDNDPLELLNEMKVKNPLATADERLIASFEEINKFYETNGREPIHSSEMNERGLFARLKGLKNNSAKIKFLKQYDRFNLLSNNEIHEVTSIEDIFDNDPFGLLGNDEEDIFTLINIPRIDKDREKTDFVAQRKVCEDFEKYEAMFAQCQKELKDGKRKLVKFNERFFEKGAFFILKGVLVYLEDIHNLRKDKNHKLDARTTLIFENGTYSNMLLRSLGKGLYEDGYFVSEHEDKVLNRLNQITPDDKQNGYIYVLNSLSNDDKIATKKNLFKIGFSTTAVETRIKNALKDPTYFMAEVRTVAAYEVYNVNPHKLEQLIHKFFGNSCLDIDIIDEKGNIHRPREWFIAPLDVIEEVIELIISGNIINYRYDELSESLIKKLSSDEIKVIQKNS